MRNYKIELNEHQIQILNTIEHSENRRKCFSVLSYMVKHITLNGGALKKSFSQFHAMYIRYHVKMSLANFKLIVAKLADLKLISIDKNMKTNVYTINEALANGISDELANNNCSQSIGTTGVDVENENTQILNTNAISNTNTNIGDKETLFDKLLSKYKGMSGNSILNKSELKKLAKSLLFLRGVHEAHIQQWVLSKVIFSNTKIQSKGAVQYINTIITEKLVESSNYICV